MSFMELYPIAQVCPHCGSDSFFRLAPKGRIAFANDRKCKDCGTRFTPPTPPWAGVLFICAGGFFVVLILLTALSEKT
jgi:hypothetical protein